MRMAGDSGPRTAVEIVAAFADDEPVDPVQLDAALADAEGRAYLIDLLVLRGLVEGHGVARPSAARRLTPADTPAAAPRRAVSIVRWWSAAAAIAVVSLVGGYLAGQYVPAGPLVPDGIRPDSDIAAPRDPGVASPIAAPAPTSVIRLEPGVDWQEQGSGS